ncbi:RluA family pseudouridine synthase [Neptuniibacter halophilus]|uniref:RluA family pseudouridine synthase n=1 Tax=Neptuniibacter halophilus TaxID=651666 RepID=UPI002573C4FA|nr:RluA family pseudouridine synthase [Neptuniibacter halophilus]
MADSFRLQLRAGTATRSLQALLQKSLARGHISQLPELWQQGRIRVEGKVAVADQPLCSGSRVDVELPGHYEQETDTRWRLLWENDALMVVFKPALLPVSRTTRNLYNTLISLVRRETEYCEAQLLHRLDTETAGLLLLAKDKAADKRYKPQLSQLIRRKLYRAWVSGEPQWEQQLLEVELSEKVGSAIRSQVYVVDPLQPEAYPKPKLSKTGFRVLRRESGKSLLECELFSGRKHQIRASLAHLGYPVIGDKIYSHGGRYYLQRLQQPLQEEDFARLGAGHQLLLAWGLELNLPQGSVCIHCPPDCGY